MASRTSAFSFKGKTPYAHGIVANLLVSHIVEGSVRKQGDQPKVTAQLIRTDDGCHLWSGTLEDWLSPARLAGSASRKAAPGHEFGMRLAERDRRALIAFLKTL